MITARIVADSVSPVGKRITTMELVYPRFIHAEVMTHRAFSRNASSSRAIPVAKAIELARDEMVFPVRWGLNQKGMQAKSEDIENQTEAAYIWNGAARACIRTAHRLSELGLHKQWANRMIEWFSNIRVLVTATEWDNFFELRDHEDAQDEIRLLAQAMRQAMDDSTPRSSCYHLPYIVDSEWYSGTITQHALLKISAARCCRVSYLKHDGGTPSIEEDLSLFDRLAGSRPIHASPLEHQAISLTNPQASSRNFKGWKQHREVFEEYRYA